jgi:Integrator complex subunit 5 C-terminus
VNAFKKNPIWMGILESASAYPDAFLYYSPLLRPVYISLFIHWETSMEGPTSVRNGQAREQTLWLLRCLSKVTFLTKFRVFSVNFGRFFSKFSEQIDPRALFLLGWHLGSCRRP